MVRLNLSPADLPSSLLFGVDTLSATILGVASIRHRSALQRLRPFDGTKLVGAIYDQVRRNYDRGGATHNKDRSAENWRWHSLQPQIAAHNRSPEVVVERAIAAACQRLSRTDWANQVPVASGLIAGAGDGRRAIDLIRRRGPSHFELIELKIASDTPLYAAIEIVGYACLWLIAKQDRPARPSAILDADVLDLRVLAPAAFYAPYALASVEEALRTGVANLGRQHSSAMSFAYEVLDARIQPGAIPADDILLQAVSSSARLCGK